MSARTIPLFPLRTVLFPGGPLPLRVFEPRYLDMVSACMKNSEPFGVVLIVDGPEVAANKVLTQATGTLATITDWYQGTDGLLGITAMGSDRFRLIATHRQDDGLNLGDVEVLPPEPEVPVPAAYKRLADVLRAVLNEIGPPYDTVPKNFDDASWVSYRLTEILPIKPEQKQYCLELDDPVVRLEFLQPFLAQVNPPQS